MPKPKELYLYSGVYDYIAEDLISRMEENAGNDIVLRVNSPGGSVFSGWGIVAKMQEAEGNITVKVDGWAASMAAFILLFADRVEALDASMFLLHRADMNVRNDDDQAFLDKVNKDLKTKMAAKLNFDKLKELKGVDIEDLFNPKTRIDVVLTAKEAKQIGLVNKINKLEPAEVAAFNERFYSVAAQLDNPTPNNNTMTLAELKEKHPAVYAEAVNAGKADAIKEGVTKERNRVLAHIAYADVDLKKTIEGITKGEELSAEQRTELETARITKGVLANIEKQTPGALTTQVTEEQKTAKAKQVSDFEAAVNESLGLKK